MTDGKGFPRIPPPFVSVNDVPGWLRDLYALNALEIRSVMIEIARIPLRFRVDDDDDPLTTWNGWDVDWEAGRARWRGDPPNIDHRLSVSWDAVMFAVARVQKPQRQPPSTEATLDAAAGGPGSAKPGALTYSQDALRAWFMLRVTQWKSNVFPTEAEDHAAALAEFDEVPRDQFRMIRRVKTPANWHKPGPRKSRD